MSLTGSAPLVTVSSCPLPSCSALQPVASKFFIYLLTLFIVSTTSASIMYAYSPITSVTVVALLLSALTFVFSMVQCYSIHSEPEPGNLHVNYTCMSSILCAVVWWILHSFGLTSCVAAMDQVPEPLSLCSRGKKHGITCSVCVCDCVFFSFFFYH